MPETTSNPGQMYRYTNARGVETIVGRLKDVPARFRDQAIPVRGQIQREAPSAAKDLANKMALEKYKLTAKAKNIIAHKRMDPWALGVHLPSTAVGVALGVVPTLLLLSRRRKLLIKVALVGMGIALTTGLYFGWVRSSAGLGEAKLASPQAVIEDAQKAAEALQKKMLEQQQRLDQIE